MSMRHQKGKKKTRNSHFVFVVILYLENNSTRFEMHLYASKRQQNTPHKFYFRVIPPNSSSSLFRFLCIHLGLNFIFRFPDTWCVLRFILYAYTIHCFHGFNTPSLVYFLWSDIFFVFCSCNSFTTTIQRQLFNGCCFVFERENCVCFCPFANLSMKTRKYHTKFAHKSENNFLSRWCLQRNLFSIDSTVQV